jgi:hypothetical protein
MSSKYPIPDLMPWCVPDMLEICIGWHDPLMGCHVWLPDGDTPEAGRTQIESFCQVIHDSIMIDVAERTTPIIRLY